MLRTVIMPFVIAQTLLGSAQIIEIGTGVYTEVYTLRTVGVKMISDADNDTVVIYHPDLTEYMTIFVPPLPPFEPAGPTYFSEDLFDTDPTTIEYCVQYIFEDQLKFRVYRTDGTVLFEQDDVFMAWTGLSSPAQSAEPIFNTPMGTRMILVDYSNVEHVYSLPGIMPCIACDGSTSMGVQAPVKMNAPGSLELFPVPAFGQVQVRYDLPPSAHGGQLFISDAEGRTVQRVNVTAKHGSHLISTEAFAEGTYYCRILTDHGIVATGKFVVAR